MMKRTRTTFLFVLVAIGSHVAALLTVSGVLKALDPQTEIPGLLGSVLF